MKRVRETRVSLDSVLIAFHDEATLEVGKIRRPAGEPRLAQTSFHNRDSLPLYESRGVACGPARARHCSDLVTFVNARATLPGAVDRMIDHPSHAKLSRSHRATRGPTRSMDLRCSCHVSGDRSHENVLYFFIRIVRYQVARRALDRHHLAVSAEPGGERVAIPAARARTIDTHQGRRPPLEVTHEDIRCPIGVVRHQVARRAPECHYPTLSAEHGVEGVAIAAARPRAVDTYQRCCRSQRRHRHPYREESPHHR